MENFRDFEAGPDPFGRVWHVQFKYLQTAISIRHSDSVDVRFILENGDNRIRRPSSFRSPTSAPGPNAPGREVSDAWCSRIAMCRIREVIATAEDLEKDYIAVTPPKSSAMTRLSGSGKKNGSRNTRPDDAPRKHPVASALAAAAFATLTARRRAGNRLARCRRSSASI